MLTHIWNMQYVLFWGYCICADDKNVWCERFTKQVYLYGTIQTQGNSASVSADLSVQEARASPFSVVNVGVQSRRLLMTRGLWMLCKVQVNYRSRFELLWFLIIHIYGLTSSRIWTSLQKDQRYIKHFTYLKCLSFLFKKQGQRIVLWLNVPLTHIRKSRNPAHYCRKLSFFFLQIWNLISFVKHCVTCLRPIIQTIKWNIFLEPTFLLHMRG